MQSNVRENEIRLIRRYNAPLKMVWEAWAEPSQAAHWWGPRGFTITTHSKELKAGGHWAYTMHSADGTNFPNMSRYYEVETHSRLVYDHGASDDSPPIFRVTVNFSEKPSQTEMDMTMSCSNAEAARKIKEVIKKASGDTTWDRLGEYLEKRISGREIFMINRSFPTSLERMFELWTKKEHLEKWIPPSEFTMQYFRADIRSGGSAFYVMNGANLFKMYGRAEYLEIVPPDRLRYRQQFCDEHEKPGRHPMAPTFPASLLTNVVFCSEGPNTTRVTILWTPDGDVTADELNTFIQARAGMTMGWTGSFDKLEQQLASR